MKAGTLRHIVDIEYRAGDTSDGYGNTTASWQKLWQNIPAEVKSTITPETYVGGEVQSQKLVTITTRYLSGIDDSMRLLFDGRYFNISSINNVEERDIELIFTTKEVIAQAAEPTFKLMNQSGLSRIKKSHTETMESRAVIICLS